MSQALPMLLDERNAARSEELHLPMPSDTRLRCVIDRMIEAPVVLAPGRKEAAGRKESA